MLRFGRWVAVLALLGDPRVQLWADASSDASSDSSPPSRPSWLACDAAWGGEEARRRVFFRANTTDYANGGGGGGGGDAVRPPLYFLHIPKNAGTTIEVRFARGSKADPGYWRRVAKARWARDHPAAEAPPADPQWKLDFRACRSWHTPPRHVHPNPYETTDTFCVVRDPFDRAVSEFKFRHAASRVSNTMNSSLALNAWLQVPSRPRTTSPKHGGGDRPYPFVPRALRWFVAWRAP